MQKIMPIGSYKWFREITLSETFSEPAGSAFGYVVEVDLAYPANVHDVYIDLPLALEKTKVPTEWRSDYANSFKLNVSSSIEKLVENLLDQTHNIRRYENLIFFPSKT